MLLDVGDAWDNIGAAFDTFTIYALNFFILKDGLLQKQNRPEKKYQKSTLSEAQMKGILLKLTTEMEQQQPYLNSKLTLKKLAERIKVSPHHLSQILNEQ
ncbi:MAG: AraC family transcriptional regulator, partial [Saprospiraceae bacterium]